MSTPPGSATPAGTPLPGVRVGAVALPGPVIAASGTAGHSDELAAFVDLSRIGAVVVKSMASFEWPGNPAPRLHAIDGGMINSVGLQGRGTQRWMSDDLPRLTARGAHVVASIWGFRAAEYESAARDLAGVASQLVALEVNLSCPNLDHGRQMFAHDAGQITRVIGAVRRALPASVPVWAKMSPNTDRLVDLCGVALDAGAGSLVLVNTVLGLRIDTESRRAVLGNGGGGVSGAAIHAVAVRCVHDVHRAFPTAPIVGVGGVSNANDAIELMMAGASAVQVGTATFGDPRAVAKIQRAMLRWARRHGVRSWDEVTGSAQ